ncbi:hypothetical protein ElyMa_002438300, partial [Elysia marginata]
MSFVLLSGPVAHTIYYFPLFRPQGSGTGTGKSVVNLSIAVSPLHLATGRSPHKRPHTTTRPLTAVTMVTEPLQGILK